VWPLRAQQERHSAASVISEQRHFCSMRLRRGSVHLSKKLLTQKLVCQVLSLLLTTKAATGKKRLFFCSSVYFGMEYSKNMKSVLFFYGEVASVFTFHCPMQCFNASLEGRPWRLHHSIRHFE